MGQPLSPVPLRRLRWFGGLGALLLALGGLGAGAVGAQDDPYRSLGVIRWFRTDVGLALAVLTSVVGIAVLVGAWWAIGRRLRAGSTVAPRWMTVTATLWALPVFVTAPLFSEDLYSYAAQGELLTHGLDPYHHGPSALHSAWLASVPRIWQDAPAPYGPVYLQLAALAVRLSGGDLFVALLLLRLAAAGGLALVAGYGPRLARACGVAPTDALWLGLASPLVVAHLVGGGHNDAVMIGLLVAGLAIAAQRRGLRGAILGSALVALAALVKAPAAVALPFLILLVAGTGRGRLWRGFAIVAGTTVLVVGLVTGVTRLRFGWVVAAASSPGVTVQWTSIPTGLGMAAGAVAGVLGAPASTDTAVAISRVLATVLAAGIVVGLWWRVRRTEEVGRVVRTSGYALLTVVILAPVFHPWYFLWAAVPLALSESAGRRRWWLALATAALAFLVFPSGHSLARITVAPGVILDVLVTAAVLTWAVRRHRPAPR